jgi:predicted DNA binding protein
MSRVLTLRLWHPGCWTLAATEEIDGLELVASNVSSTPTHVIADIQATGEDDALGSLLGWLESDKQIQDRYVLDFSSSRRLLRLFVTYAAKNSIFSSLIEHHVAPVKPIRIREGYEYWTVCTSRDDAPALLLEDSSFSDCELKILSIRGLESVKRKLAGDEGGDLTPRQLDILLQALRSGYYNWPRRISAKELAQELGLSAPTVLEHLRKSESKIVRSFVISKLENGRAHG